MKHLPQVDFTFDKAFCITRNPIDVFVSMFLLVNLGSMSISCEEKINEEYPEEWDQFIRTRISTFKEFHTYLIE